MSIKAILLGLFIALVVGAGPWAISSGIAQLHKLQPVKDSETAKLQESADAFNKSLAGQTSSQQSDQQINIKDSNQKNMDGTPGAAVQTLSTATMHTNKGDIVLAFYPDRAPNTVANFMKLAKSGFYDGTKFHRVIKGFMDQGGDPLTKDDSKMAQWGTGGPGYKLNDEIGSNNINLAGTIAMANSGPNTAGSQFFINAVDNHSLDTGYTVFGHVVSGMDVVTLINNVPTGASDRPIDPVILESVIIK